MAFLTMEAATSTRRQMRQWRPTWMRTCYRIRRIFVTLQNGGTEGGADDAIAS
jgi:hypothetical protein